MNTVLICGGFLEEETAKRALEKIKPDCIIGIDKGLEFCYRNQIYPQYILGDFDSIDKRCWISMKIRRKFGAAI